MEETLFSLSETCVYDKLLQSCLTLHDPMGYSLPDSVLGILQARILEWLPRPPPGDLPNPGIEPISLMSPALTDRIVFTASVIWEALTTWMNVMCFLQYDESQYWAASFCCSGSFQKSIIMT